MTMWCGWYQVYTQLLEHALYMTSNYIIVQHISIVYNSGFSLYVHQQMLFGIAQE